MTNKEKYWLVKEGQSVLKRSDPENKHPSFSGERSFNEMVSDAYGNDFMPTEKLLQGASGRWADAEKRRVSGKPYKEDIPTYNFNTVTGEHTGFLPRGKGSWSEPNYDYANASTKDMSRIPAKEFIPNLMGTQKTPELPHPFFGNADKRVQEIWYKNLRNRGAAGQYHAGVGKLKPQIELFGYNPKPGGFPIAPNSTTKPSTPIHEGLHDLISPNWKPGNMPENQGATWLNFPDSYKGITPGNYEPPWDMGLTDPMKVPAYHGLGGRIGYGPDGVKEWENAAMEGTLGYRGPTGDPEPGVKRMADIMEGVESYPGKGRPRPYPSIGEEKSDEAMQLHGGNIEENIATYGPLKRQHYNILKKYPDYPWKDADKAKASRDAYMQALEASERGEPVEWQPSKWDMDRIMENAVKQSPSMKALDKNKPMEEWPKDRHYDMIQLSQNDKGRGLAGLAAGRAHA